MRKTLFLNDRQVLSKITPRIAIILAERAFTAWGLSKVQMPAKVYLSLPKGDFRAMPAYVDEGGGVVGIKWISVYPLNASKGLAAVNGTLLLSDPDNGCLLAVMAANALTALRTGAAGALATRVLSNPNASRLLLVGSGVQSEYQLMCHQQLRRWSAVRVWAPDLADAKSFARRMGSKGLVVTAEGDLEKAVRASDVISTCTPSKKPLIRKTWVQPGTHINAIGADAPGKQELDVQLLKGSRIVIDDWEQASHSGEINVAYSKGVIKKTDVLANLGEAMVRRIKIRRMAGEITIFDSTGLAVQDMIMAAHVFRSFTKGKTTHVSA